MSLNNNREKTTGILDAKTLLTISSKFRPSTSPRAIGGCSVILCGKLMLQREEGKAQNKKKK